MGHFPTNGGGGGSGVALLVSSDDTIEVIDGSGPTADLSGEPSITLAETFAAAAAAAAQAAAEASSVPILQGLVFDHGASNAIGAANRALINSALIAQEALGGGTIFLPVSTNILGVDQDINVPQGCHLASFGTYKRKVPGSAIPAAGNVFGCNIGPCTGAAFTTAVVNLLTNTSGIKMIGVFGNGSAVSGNNLAPRAIYNNSEAGRVESVFGWGGQIAVCDTPNVGNAGIDSDYLESTFINNLNNQGLQFAGCVFSTADATITVPDTTGMLVGQFVNTLDGTLLPSTTIVSINSGTSITLSTVPTADATLTLIVNPLWMEFSTCGVTNGSDVLRVPSSAGLIPGMSISGGALGVPTNAIIASIIDGTSIQMTGPASNGTGTLNKTIDFQAGLTLRIVGTSDVMLSNVRCLSGTTILAGADGDCGTNHFSGGGACATFNLIQSSGKGCCHTGTTFDSATNIAGLFRRDGGPISFAGCRFQNGNNNIVSVPGTAVSTTTPDVTVTSSAGIMAGRPLIGNTAFFAANTTVLTVNSGTSITLSANPIQSGVVTLVVQGTITQIPALTDFGSDGKGICAVAITMPNVGNDGFVSLCDFGTQSTPGQSQFGFVEIDSKACQNTGNAIYRGGLPSWSGPVIQGGALQPVIGAVSTSNPALQSFAGPVQFDTAGLPLTANPAAGAGTGPTVVVTGNQQSGQVTVTPGTAPATGALVQMAYASALAEVPQSVTLSPANLAARVTNPYVSGVGTVNGFTIDTSTLPIAGTAVVYNYHVDY